MQLTRRATLAGVTGLAATRGRRVRAERAVVRVGVLTDLSGPYRDINGPNGVACAEQAAADEAAKAREVYQEAIDAGWTATELTSAGLKPPAPPRKRGSSSEAEPAAAAS